MENIIAQQLVKMQGKILEKIQEEGLAEVKRLLPVPGAEIGSKSYMRIQSI